MTKFFAFFAAWLVSSIAAIMALMVACYTGSLVCAAVAFALFAFALFAFVPVGIEAGLF